MSTPAVGSSRKTRIIVKLLHYIFGICGIPAFISVIYIPMLFHHIPEPYGNMIRFMILALLSYPVLFIISVKISNIALAKGKSTTAIALSFLPLIGTGLILYAHFQVNQYCHNNADCIAYFQQYMSPSSLAPPTSLK